MIKVAIEARALSRPSSGVKTYVSNLVRGLEQHPDIQLARLIDGPSSELAIPWWLNTSVPKWASQQKPDVVHYTKAAVPQRKQFPTVVTIYDVIPMLFPESQKLAARIMWPATLRHAAKKADHIITISEASKRDIVQHLNVEEKKVSAITLATDIKTGEHGGEPQANSKPYILFVSTIEPRKNAGALVRAFSRAAIDIPHELRIVGREYKGAEEVRDEIKRSAFADRIKLVGVVSNEERDALYSGADVFVLPSLYEGWSFPTQEAMAAGTPVIVSDGGALPEVVGSSESVVPFTTEVLSERKRDEEFEKRLGEKMKEVISSKKTRDEIVTAGFGKLRARSWSDVVTNTVGVYEEVLL